MKPQYIMLGGRSCAGKSLFIKTISEGGLGLVDRDSFIILDIDSIKRQLPEYSEDNACLFHSESCHMFEETSAMARERGLNIAHELIMTDPARTIARAKEFMDAGYEIKAYYMFIPPQEAARRAIDRFATEDEDFSGRFIPPEAVLTLQQNNEVTFDLLCEFVSEWHFYDNQGSIPELIASGTNDGDYSFTKKGSTLQLETAKGVTKISDDGLVVTSDGTVVESCLEEPYRDDKGEIMCFADGAPILLRHFINEPD